MFLCGYCNTNNEDANSQIYVSNMDEVNKFEQHLKSKNEGSKLKSNGQQGSEFSVKMSTAMIKASHYDKYLQQCKKNNTKFQDKEFPRNNQSLNFSVPNREITWKRISDIIPNCVMVEEKIQAKDVYQGNIGDCYFLASIAALAEVPRLIDNIFLNNFEINGYAIYKVIANVEGVITEVLIDDFIPVYATTNRPVFCKANGKQVWVMLLEKAWAKIKGSYGAISAGTPHEVFNAFCMAPSFTYPIHHQHNKEYKDMVWQQLEEGAKHNMPACFCTKKEVGLNGLKPFHAYTALNCMSIPVNGKNYRIVRLRNPWGSTEYNGHASQNDKQFWDKVPIEYKQAILPPKGKDDGDFVMPFSQLLKHFQCVEICHFRPDFSYEFQFMSLTKEQPSFAHLQIQEEHEAYITIQKIYNEQAKKALAKSSENQGYTRLIIARQQEEKYEYFQSKMQTNFADTTIRCNLKKGNYLIMVQGGYPTDDHTFKCVLSYYYAPLEERSSKKLTIPKNHSYNKMDILNSILLNHAYRLSNQSDTTKLSSRAEDRIITTLLNQQGGYGYVVCSLHQETKFKLRIVVDQQAIEQSGYQLMTEINHTDIEIYAGQQKIFIFSVNLNKINEQLSFPPSGFKITKVV